MENEAIWNGELTEEDAGRFENCYVDIRYLFRRGDFVREVGNGEIGVAETEKDDEEYEASRLRLAERQKQGYCGENRRCIRHANSSKRMIVRKYF